MGEYVNLEVLSLWNRLICVLLSINSTKRVFAVTVFLSSEAVANDILY